MSIEIEMKIDLTHVERKALLAWLERKLRNFVLLRSYAKILNGLYKKLTGRDHECWGNDGENYGEDHPPPKT